MKGKSRTFVRALVPRRRKKAAVVANDPPKEVGLDVDGNIDATGEDGSSGAHWEQKAWEDLRVGDFVKVLDNEPIPADILICATSEEENVAFVRCLGLIRRG
jgi:cation transport ATPase